STNAGRRARLKDFGADLAIDTAEPNWSEKVLAATDKKGVDLIVDQVSASVANENMKAAAVLGRIVNVGRLGGQKGEFDFDLQALKVTDHTAAPSRPRSGEGVGEIAQARPAALGEHVEGGKPPLPIDKAFPLEQAAAALAHMRANQHFGKIVLTA